jgi:hypothetical protein
MTLPDPWNMILMAVAAIGSAYAGSRFERYRLKRLEFSIEIDRRNSGRPLAKDNEPPPLTDKVVITDSTEQVKKP